MYSNNQIISKKTSWPAWYNQPNRTPIYEFISNYNRPKILSQQPTRLSNIECLLCTCSCAGGKMEVQFSVAIGN